MEKTLKESGDKVSQADRDAVTRALDRLKSLKDSNSAEEIKKAIEELTQASHKLAQVMYESAAQRGQGPGASSAGGKREEKGKGEEVIDADFDVKD